MRPRSDGKDKHYRYRSRNHRREARQRRSPRHQSRHPTRNCCSRRHRRQQAWPFATRMHHQNRRRMPSLPPKWARNRRGTQSPRSFRKSQRTCRNYPRRSRHRPSVGSPRSRTNLRRRWCRGNHKPTRNSITRHHRTSSRREQDWSRWPPCCPSDPRSPGGRRSA